MVQLLVLRVVVGVVLYLINNYVPIASPIKTIINVVVLMVACIWLLRVGLVSFEHSHVVRSSEVNEDGMDQYPARRGRSVGSGSASSRAKASNVSASSTRLMPSAPVDATQPALVRPAPSLRNDRAAARCQRLRQTQHLPGPDLVGIRQLILVQLEDLHVGASTAKVVLGNLAERVTGLHGVRPGCGW